MAISTRQAVTGFLAVPAAATADAIRRAAARVFDTILMLAEASSRGEEIRYLQSLSDDQLAKMGLRRDRIVAHVFRDRLHFY